VSADLEPTSESLIRQLKEVAERLGRKSVSRSEFVRETGISEYQVRKHFDNWNAFVKAANLDPTNTSRIEDSELFQAMKDAFIAAGQICTQTRFEKLCRYNVSVYRRRGWGNWIGVLTRFREWATTNAPDFPYLDQLPTARPQTTAPQLPAGTNAVQSATSKPVSAAWPARGGRKYGSLINFRGLLHAPMNENGVVFLFGMIAQELGYVVESITPGFPDCEAKRQVSRSGDTWERVRIEFEFESRAFLTHGHDISNCDLIVCWEANWPDCPIEVLELKSAIQELEG
jgi:hypothetical protein